MKLNNLKKAQGLPLNTIVIAILVLIVLLVIVLFFTSSSSDSTGQIREVGNLATICSEENSIYGNQYSSIDPVDRDSCEEGDVLPITGGLDDGQVCCAVK